MFKYSYCIVVIRKFVNRNMTAIFFKFSVTSLIVAKGRRMIYMIYIYIIYKRKLMQLIAIHSITVADLTYR